MSSAAEEYLIYQIANASMLEYPYPHMYVEQVFEPDFYAELRANWPESSSLTSLAETGRVSKGAYPDRFILPFTKAGVAKLPEDRRTFWTEFGSWFLGSRLRDAVITRYARYVNERFGDKAGRCRFEIDALIVRDRTNYKIGPHTDAPHRLLSLLFYCPDDAGIKHLGTTIYVPRDPEFTCQGGPHYPHKQFTPVKTMQYLPNSLFAFFKTDRSFHGVAPIGDENVLRDILLYDIRVFNEKTAPAPQAGSLGVGMLRRLLGTAKPTTS